LKKKKPAKRKVNKATNKSFAKNMDKPLSIRQQLFKTNYIKNGGNAYRAAIDAGYPEPTACKNAPGWANAKTAKLSRSPRIWKEIQKYKKGLVKKCDLTEAEVAERYKRLIDSDVRDFFDEDGMFKGIPKIEKELAYTIDGFDIKTVKLLGADGKPSNLTETVTKVKLSSKKAALDSIAKIMGMFVETRKIEFDKDTLDAILRSLPSEFAEGVRRELGDIVSKRRS